ncbi:MAG: dipeptidyl aminopeptidase [Pseudomonadota bacterium]
MKNICCAWLLVCAAATALPAAAQEERPTPEVLRLPLSIGGSRIEVVTHVYKPPGPGPFPLVIFSHGRAPQAADRAKQSTPVLAGHAQYWMRKGVAVVAPIRPGYGDTGGEDREYSNSRWKRGTLECYTDPDFNTVAEHARETVVATYRWAQQQPWVRKDRILLEGQSVGGLTTVAAAALNLPGVVGAVNFSGGAGGNPATAPAHSCRPDRLTQVYRAYGTQVRVPSLWLYAENDQFWGPDVPRDWVKAFQAGGSEMQFVRTGPVEGYDGHQLLARGGKMWAPPLTAFANKVGLLRP